MKEWDQAGIKLATPESAVRLASVARHATHCLRSPVNIHYHDDEVGYTLTG